MTPFIDLAIWAFVGVILFVALEVYTEGKEYKPDIQGMIFGFVIAVIMAWLSNTLPIKEIFVIIAVLLGKPVSKLLNKAKNGFGKKENSETAVISYSKVFTDNERKEPASYIGLGFFLVLLLVVDINVARGSLSSSLDLHHKTFLGHWFTGKWNDWVGIVLFNFNVITLITGIFGVWRLYESPNKTTWGKVWAGFSAAMIALIYL